MLANLEGCGLTEQRHPHSTEGRVESKTGDQRSVPLSAELHAILQSLPRTGKWVFTAAPTARFPATRRQVSPRRAMAHLKVVLNKRHLHGHLHTFRHSFISHALTSGVAPAIVRTWVGHVDEEIMKAYTHIADQQSHAALDKILPGSAGPSVGTDANAKISPRAHFVHRKHEGQNDISAKQ